MQKQIALTTLSAVGALGCVLLLGFAPSLLAAQEEIPNPKAPSAAKPAAPAPVPNPPVERRAGLGLNARNPERAALRAQRRERLRVLGGQVLDGISQIDLSSDAAATPGTPAASAPRIDAIIKPLLEVLGNNGMIESLGIRLDPEGTKLDEDRVRLDAVAALRHTPWSDEPSRLTGKVGVHVAKNEQGRLVAVIDGKTHFDTQTLPMANYLLAQYKQRSQAADADPDAPPGPPSPDEIFQMRLAEKLATIDEIKSMDDLGDLMVQVAELRLAAVNERIERLRSDLAAAADDAARKEVESELAKARADRDKLFNVRPRIERAKDGTAQAIALSLAGADVLPGAEMRKLDVRLTAADVDVDFDGVVSRYVELYPAIRPIVMGMLQRIQNGDARALDNIRALLETALSGGLSAPVEAR